MLVGCFLKSARYGGEVRVSYVMNYQADEARCGFGEALGLGIRNITERLGCLPDTLGDVRAWRPGGTVEDT